MPRYYYISRYSQYPIYEPAEGGYYYEGTSLDEYIRTTSLKKARKLLKKMVQEDRPWEDTPYSEEEMMDTFSVPQNHFYVFTKYIGDGVEYHIETKLGSHEHGYRPYC